MCDKIIEQLGELSEAAKKFDAIKSALGMSSASDAPYAEDGGEIEIVVLQRGWVAVGRVYQRGETVTIKSASVIRKWGTTKGLGEIAEGGPTDKTVLDHCPDVSCHVLGVVFRMKCVQSKWENELCSR